VALEFRLGNDAQIERLFNIVIDVVVWLKSATFSSVVLQGY